MRSAILALALAGAAHAAIVSSASPAAPESTLVVTTDVTIISCASDVSSCPGRTDHPRTKTTGGVSIDTVVKTATTTVPCDTTLTHKSRTQASSSAAASFTAPGGPHSVPLPTYTRPSGGSVGPSHHRSKPIPSGTAPTRSAHPRSTALGGSSTVVVHTPTPPPATATSAAPVATSSIAPFQGAAAPRAGWSLGWVATLAGVVGLVVV